MVWPPRRAEIKCRPLAPQSHRVVAIIHQNLKVQKEIPMPIRRQAN